jgi:hypothetical protein
MSYAGRVMESSNSDGPERFSEAIVAIDEMIKQEISTRYTR